MGLGLKAYEARMQIARFFCAAALGLGLLAGCGDDDPSDSDGAVEEGDHHGEELTAACQAIMTACHPVDVGTGEVHVCHEYAHSNDDDMCVSEKDRCIALCEAAAGDEDGGQTDHEADHDGI